MPSQHKTRHHANPRPMPAIPVVTPPKHGAQDPTTATTLNTNDSDADETNTGDNDTDNDDTRPATTMVTNARCLRPSASR